LFAVPNRKNKSFIKKFWAEPFGEELLRRIRRPDNNTRIKVSKNYRMNADETGSGWQLILTVLQLWIWQFTTQMYTLVLYTTPCA
jgi:hypothetical protein